MTWYVDQRLEWIDETLRVFGFINREHVERKFGVSTQQASADIQEFMRRRPGVVSYNKNSKRYEATAEPSSYAVGKTMQRFNRRLAEVAKRPA